MLTQPLFDKLSQLRLSAFRAALEDQMHSPHYAELSFEERLGLLVDIETTHRTQNRLKRRLKAARFPLQATMEDLDLSARRGLNRAQVLELGQGDWIASQLNLLVLGPTGSGKTYLAAASAAPLARRSTRCATTAPPVYFSSLNWLKPMAPTPNCSAVWPALGCLSSMTGSATP